MRDTREISYAAAISEATVQLMRDDESIVLMGIGLDYSSGVFGTTSAAFSEFGPDRVIDTPAMESALTAIAAGASLCGLRPVVVHARNDFMLYSFDSMINLISKWHYMFDGKASSMPVVIRGIIGRGWGQGATHSQSIQATLSHFPGLKVVMPASPSDAKGMLVSALRGQDPVVILEHRNLFSISGQVEEALFESPISGARIVREGEDVTIVATSVCVHESLIAAREAELSGISAEVIDLRVLQPLDRETIISSVRKTQRLLIVDTSWRQFGVGAEIGAVILESGVHLRSPMIRLGQNDSPAPVSSALEPLHYPNTKTILFRLKHLVTDLRSQKSEEMKEFPDMTRDFQGPY